MPTIVQFENPPGTVITSRNFTPGQTLRIYGEVTDDLGWGQAFAGISLDIEGPGVYIFDQTKSNPIGHFTFDIVLPDVNAKAVMKVISTFWTFPASTQDIVTVPISIGTDNHGNPLPPDLVPNPNPLPDTLDFNKILKGVAIAGGIIAVIWIASKAAPGIVSGYGAARKAR